MGGGRPDRGGVLGARAPQIFDVHAAQGSALAAVALERIGALYGVERDLYGKPRCPHRERQTRSKPLAEALKVWTRRAWPRCRAAPTWPRRCATCWRAGPALMRAFDDGRLALDNNAAERALRCVAVGRKNYLFAGSEPGAERAAAFYTLIELRR